MSRELLPEKERIITLTTEFLAAKPFYDAVRHLRDKWFIVTSGLDVLSPTDKFTIQVMLKQYSGGGTANTIPPDVLSFIHKLHKEMRELDENLPKAI